MPNWKLTHECRIYLRTCARSLSERALDYAQADFPLTTAQIQYAVLDPDKISTLRRYISEGVSTIETYKELRLAFLREKIPELRRGAVIRVYLPERILVGRDTQYGIETTKFDINETHYLVPSFDGVNGGTELEPEGRAELVKWINRVIRQKRIHEIVQHCLKNVLEDHAPSVAHLHMIWPILCTLVNSDDGLPQRGPFAKLWQERFRAQRRPLQVYRPKPEVWDKYAKLISAADTAIATGLLLPPLRVEPGVIRASIENWEAREGDIKAKE